ncbi:MAG: hypothetical protein HYS60_00565 [Candidatus Wildermuthbacteria bacterium]|nr:hypothetical protein [Candidatus Wildermuthbacteria bacterium]
MSNALAPSVTARDSKGLKFVSVIEAAYNKARLSEKEAQCVNDAPGLAELVGKFITENRLPNQFASEEVRSTYDYPKKHKGPKGIEDQIKALAKIFGLDPSHALEYAKNLPQLPNGAEGWFAIPRWEKVAKTYNEAIERMLKVIASMRKFTNYREGQLGPDRLRQSQRTIEMLNKIGETQQGDILIIAGQLGLRHRGRSVRRARVVFQTNEFGFGAFAVGCMLLTHPERLEKYEDLFIDCAGEEYDYPGDAVRFGHAPCFHFRGGRVGFVTGWVGGTGVGYGSSSGFAPQ